MSESSSFPTLDEAESVVPPSTLQPFHWVWGPISHEASTSVGAEFATSSVLIEPLLESEVVDAAVSTVPVSVLPLPGDTQETLVARLSESSFLEDSHLPHGLGQESSRQK